MNLIFFRLTASLRQDTQKLVSGKSQHEKDKLENCLSGFPSLSKRLQQITEQGMQLLRQSVIKPRIKPWVDTFPSHDITEDTFADYEANDPFVQTFIMNLDSLLGKIFLYLFNILPLMGLLAPRGQIMPTVILRAPPLGFSDLATVLYSLAKF